ncbi:MAG: hypothetical protein M3R02_03795 [Chloroflexota bacterium]|nr:hypothetical protein [Chloroflexota bacterium]
MARLSHTWTHSQSTPPVNPPSLADLPILQLIAQITSLEMWRVDLWVATPGSQVYGLPADAVAGFVSDHLDSLRRELRAREEIAEVER